jgi:hypothetical protein
MEFYGGQFDPEQLISKLGRGDAPNRNKPLLDPKLCGSYIAILTKPGIDHWKAGHALSLLSQMPRVHPYLLELAARWANHEERRVRAVVADFYAAHGDRRHLPIIMALLYDPDPFVCYSAADAIPRVGTKEALVALDIWLARPPHADGDLMRRVEKRKRELYDRLSRQ